MNTAVVPAGADGGDGLAIEVRGVSKHFTLHADRRDSLKERFVRGRSRDTHVFRALDDVSFAVKRGITFGLVGHNGSGKSTMLKILAGVYRPNEGEVMVSSKVDALLEVGAGFHGELTGRENIYLNGAILGRTKKQIDDSIDWIINFADIGDFIDEPVKVYSSGMTVRLGFAAAVAIEPEILVVDEIIAVGDEEFQRKCFDLMRQLRDRGTTIVLVTHSLSLATEMCDEVVWLDHGKVQMVGDADEVVSAYLTSVNEKEARQRALEQPEEEFPEDDQYKLNQGNGDCRMTGVELLDGDLDEVSFATYGKPLTVRVHVNAKKDLHDVELGLGFSTDGGVTIAGPNSKAAGTLYSLRPGDSFIDYKIDQVVFQPGRLWLTTCFVRDGQIFDLSDRRTELIVRADRTMDEPGLVTLAPGQWSKRPGLPAPGEGQQ
ncbi:ABC-2 type transport system ATP-binding protein/lipopolysaccharide transport system ATP-binding protein [Actinomyces ruminicola]|uniref:ABC-2 type transport system ATP-binding protein/lipopolysaccharide transport system ATP-binding protein n=1 Tax=Actinomyces ruminicola TaxID=332524 RepID=A0A1G9ZQZ9_9ACTO|nr:ABC transporter ATP-binding protein [Actinomyces ruminicola]SDN23614.1 ABC-2 type transport system ATP-binding protein/lipopolysaccharide transport system ATP-binding protein [Actinomyces ruminicola]